MATELRAIGSRADFDDITAELGTATVDPKAERENYVALRQTLAQAGLWNRIFDESLEDAARPRLLEVLKEDLKHNPRLVEMHLGEIASLLDRCLEYRREAADLEIQGVAAGIRRFEADVLNALDEKILQEKPQVYSSAPIALQYPKAATAYGEGKDALARGNAIQAAAQAASHAALASHEEAKTLHSLKRLRFVAALDRQAMGRFDQPGSAQNYVQRFCRVRQLFEVDIVAAYRRALAASAFLRDCYTFTETLTTPDDPDLLDSFVIWTKGAMRVVALGSEREIEIVRHIRILDDGSKVWSTTLGFPGFFRPRLRGVAACYLCSLKEQDDADRGNLSFGVVLAHPSDGAVVLLPAVRMYRYDRPIEWMEGAAIYNLDPSGIWSVRFNTVGSTSEITPPGQYAPNPDFVDGIVLLLRMACTPDPSKDASWWLAEDRL